MRPSLACASWPAPLGVATASTVALPSVTRWADCSRRARPRCSSTSWRAISNQDIAGNDPGGDAIALADAGPLRRGDQARWRRAELAGWLRLLRPLPTGRPRDPRLASSLGLHAR